MFPGSGTRAELEARVKVDRRTTLIALRYSVAAPRHYCQVSAKLTNASFRFTEKCKPSLALAL